MKKLLFLCCALLTLSMAQAQWPNVSTGITTSGGVLGPCTADPNWKLVLPNPVLPNTDTYIEPYFAGFWEITPIGATNAGWIHPNCTQSQDVPGEYWFDRKFTIAPGTGSFSCNFKVAYDDNVPPILLLVPPNFGPPIQLTVVPTTPFKLSKLIKKTIDCPQEGEWSIRAKVTFIDGLGGFLLSGSIDTSTSGCDKPCDCNLSNTVTTNGEKKTIICGDTVNLACGTTNKFAPKLDCNGDASTHLQSIKLVDMNGNTPLWAGASFYTNLGTGNLIIPAGESGLFTLTYFWGRKCEPCDSCSYILKIECQELKQVIISPSGINSSENIVSKTNAQVFPNPFENGFTLKLPENNVADVQITNMLGLPLEIKTKATGSIQMGNDLSYGVYTITVKYNNGTKEEIKVIKNPK